MIGHQVPMVFQVENTSKIERRKAGEPGYTTPHDGGNDKQKANR